MTNAVMVPVVGAASPTLRQATADDAEAIHELIASHLADGHLLPRTLSDITVHAHRFVVAVGETENAEADLKVDPYEKTGPTHERIVGCVDLAPLSRTVAEVRSMVVIDELRSNGVGRQLLDAILSNAKREGFERICAFTHAPSYFVRLGFSLVPHEWLPEKIRTDCGTCALFRRCGQYAVVLPLASLLNERPTSRSTSTCVPLASLHG